MAVSLSSIKTLINVSVPLILPSIYSNSSDCSSSIIELVISVTVSPLTVIAQPLSQIINWFCRSCCYDFPPVFWRMSMSLLHIRENRQMKNLAYVSDYLDCFAFDPYYCLSIAAYSNFFSFSSSSTLA